VTDEIWCNRHNLTGIYLKWNSDTSVLLACTFPYLSRGAQQISCEGSRQAKRRIGMTNEEKFLGAALNAWKGNIERADKMFSNLTAKELLNEVAPGRNRLIYLWGHLTAVHDAMLPLLGFGPRRHPEYDDLFISKPDKATTTLPSAEDIKKSWTEANSKLSEGFATLSAADWLQRHSAVSEQDFAKEPLRNRFAILLSRTNHLSHHLGQTALAPK
jgi:hypothetical protein